MSIYANSGSLRARDIEAGSSTENEKEMGRNNTPHEGLSENFVGGPNHTNHADEVDKWAGSLARMLEDVPNYMCSPGHPGRITRIPENIREIDVKAYEPYFLSIGPYHHGKPNVQMMQKKKWMILKCFLQAKPELTLKHYLDELKSIEPSARGFYSDVELGSEEFVLILLLDSLFVISLFCGIPEKQESTNDDIREGSDQITDDSDETVTEQEDTPRLFSTLFMHDLFLLENQLPFFLLQMIYALAFGGSKTQFTSIMKEAVSNMLLDYSKACSQLIISSTEEVHHILHISHMFFRPTFQQETMPNQIPESTEMFRLGSAVQLYEAGVKFLTKSGTTQYSLLDITFNSSGTMFMPCLSVDDNTNSLLRNLIALEQMKYPTLGLNVSAYAVLLLHLVTTPEDAQLLRRKGIIQHHLASDKEMMYLVNKLSVGLSFDYVQDMYSLKPVFQELKRYTERRRPRWKAWLKHRYFNNPWTTISLVAASILLLLTFVQTYFTVYSYYVPCGDCHS